MFQNKLTKLNLGFIYLNVVRPSLPKNKLFPDEEFYVKLTLIPGHESELVRLGKTCIMEITILNDDGM